MHQQASLSVRTVKIYLRAIYYIHPCNAQRRMLIALDTNGFPQHVHNFQITLLDKCQVALAFSLDTPIDFVQLLTAIAAIAHLLRILPTTVTPHHLA